MVNKILRFLLKFVFLFVVVLIITIFINYTWAPVYNFHEPSTFKGAKLYNPYRGMDSTAWKKANFQVQSKVWWGITDGRNNSSEAINLIYKQLGFDIITISDYMRINPFGNKSSNYIPVYEHGYGFRKTHQVCIGAKKVNWIDFPFYQNLNHKQYIINTLNKNNDIVALAHPQLRDGYTLQDMHYLTNYDLIEALNRCRFSVEHWDVALSHGHLSYILANDDAHDLFNPREVGMVFTIINTRSLREEAVIDALKKGKAYGVEMFMKEGSDFVKKVEDHKKLPVVTSVEIIHDTLFVSVNEQFLEINFFGQKGLKFGMIKNAKTGFYPLNHNDTYIRTEITFKNGTKFYLNPVFWYNGAEPTQTPEPIVDFTKTWIQRGISIVIAALIGIMFYFNKHSGRRRRRISSHSHYYFS